MDRWTKTVAAEARQKFLLDEVVSVKRSASGDCWIVKVHKFRIGDGNVPSGIDKSKEYTYRATFNGCSAVFTEEKS
jgi:hypothetical protein